VGKFALHVVSAEIALADLTFSVNNETVTLTSVV